MCRFSETGEVSPEIRADAERIHDYQNCVREPFTFRAIAALGVIILTPHIREYLKRYDPQALRHAREALGLKP